MSEEGAATTAPATSTGGDWTTGLSEDHRGYVQNKGFQNPSSVLDSYRNLEKLMGAPKERLLTLPEKDDAPEWGDIYNRMGRPGSADDYKLDMPNQGGDENFAKWARSNFHELGLSRKQAEGLASRWNQFQGETNTQNSEKMATQAIEQETSLKKEWGQNYNSNVEIAKRAATTFGITAEVLDKLEGSLGFSGVMKFMNSLGGKLGEDSFVSSEGGGQKGFGGMSSEAAKSRLTALRQDNDFVKKYVAGDVSARDEMTRLHKFAYGD